MKTFIFENAEPESLGISPAGLGDLIAYSDSLSHENGLLLLSHDRVLLERYSASSETTKWNTYSTTKSFGAALLVLALDSGAIRLADNVCGRTDMTVHHLASMTAGFPKPSDITCDAELLFQPGTDFAYSDGGTNILRDVIIDAFGVEDIGVLLRDRILAPIGADDWLWDGRFSAGLHMTVRDMARYGRLWLRKGDWDGERLFSEANANLATRASNPDLMKAYGYLWWVNSHGQPEPYDRYGFKINPIFTPRVPADAFMAIGASRTFILVVPSLELVAVRGGTGFVSIQSGDTRLSDESRGFVDSVLAALVT
ncbi:MAG: beta-lactamase family protein [Deltaproteobacteria bacterium]|nr:beta-lactamase family protein [Deltaproteobacteria bacterium]